MGIFDNFKKKKKNINNSFSSDIYSRGNGTDYDNAVIINVSNSVEGIAAEYKFIISKHVESDKCWELISQNLNNKDGKYYDILEIKLKNEEILKYYFNITNFYGKL